jgi:NAD(P)H dehydrogenase (quinone)
MIVVTGAAGKTGRALVQALVARGTAVRALVHRPEQVDSLKALGALGVVAGDMADASVLGDVLRDATAVYHICPNVHPDELEIGRRAISMARVAGINHFVYHSVLHPQVEAMPHHWQKLRVEEALLESGLNFTILQPAAYMQNVLANWTAVVGQGVYTVPYAAETRLTMVDLNDVAEAAAVVLTEPGHYGATYELAGPEWLSQTEIAAVLSDVLSRPVQAQPISNDQWRQGAESAGLGRYQIETLLKMFAYYEQYGFRGNAKVLSWLLGREPARFADFVRRQHDNSLN